MPTSIASKSRSQSTRPRRALLSIAILVLAFGLTAPPDAVARTEYTSARKVGRGFSNTLFGFLAIPGNMYKESQDRGLGWGLPIGFATGLGWFVTTELVGVWEILSCPFEVPPRFEPVIEPEFPWQYFESEGGPPSRRPEPVGSDRDDW